MKERLLKNINTYIFDMDGTLYELDGKSGGFKGSTLEQTVKRNAVEFVMKTEGLSQDGALEILNLGLLNTIGLSIFFSERYQITRKDYFNQVWDINPGGIINNFEVPVKVIKEITRLEKRLILLTSSPKIWQEKVIRYLGLDNVFESIYTGEEFGKKDEIFKLLSEKYIPSEIISIGDQKKTDIDPALEYGIKGILIKNPNDLEKLNI